jgi:hypothetical protein
MRSAQLADQDRVADAGLISDDARKNKEAGLFNARALPSRSRDLSLLRRNGSKPTRRYSVYVRSRRLPKKSLPEVRRQGINEFVLGQPVGRF